MPRAQKARYGAIVDRCDDTILNAVYHCVWQCMIRNIAECGEEGALEIGYAHENILSGNPAVNVNSVRMDLTNNARGRSRGQAARDLGGCYAACERAADERLLVWFKPLSREMMALLTARGKRVVGTNLPMNPPFKWSWNM